VSSVVASILNDPNGDRAVSLRHSRRVNLPNIISPFLPGTMAQFWTTHLPKSPSERLSSERPQNYRPFHGCASLPLLSRRYISLLYPYPFHLRTLWLITKGSGSVACPFAQIWDAVKAGSGTKHSVHRVWLAIWRDHFDPISRGYVENRLNPDCRQVYLTMARKS
jgi:hypothetical protein